MIRVPIERNKGTSRQREVSHLERLLQALNASALALRRDACGDWAINGKHGYIYGSGRDYLVYINTRSSRRWNSVKRQLAFCTVSQDGDDEGCLVLDRLPTPSEADLIRAIVGIRKHRHLSDQERARAAINLERARGLAKRPVPAPAFAEMAGP